MPTPTVLSKQTEYSSHSISLAVTLSTGTKLVGDTDVITNTLSAAIDNVDFLIRPDLSNDEVIAQIPIVEDQAEKRVDIIGTPSDSALADQLVEMGFSFL